MFTFSLEFRKKIAHLHEEEGRTYKSITAEYGVSKASISKWCSEFCKEFQTDPQFREDYDSMKENLRLKRENEELWKESAFLKQWWHSLQRKSIRGLSIYLRPSERIWRPLAAETIGNLPQCILQLPEGGLL